MNDSEEEGLPKLFRQGTTALSENAKKRDALYNVGDREDGEDAAAERSCCRRLEGREETRRRKKPNGADYAFADGVDAFDSFFIAHLRSPFVVGA